MKEAVIIYFDIHEWSRLILDCNVCNLQCKKSFGMPRVSTICFDEAISRSCYSLIEGWGEPSLISSWHNSGFSSGRTDDTMSSSHSSSTHSNSPAWLISALIDTVECAGRSISIGRSTVKASLLRKTLTANWPIDEWVVIKPECFQQLWILQEKIDFHILFLDFIVPIMSTL